MNTVQEKQPILFIAQPGLEVKKKWSEKCIEALAELDYTFRLNEIDDTIEVNGKPISDPLKDKIRTQLRDAGYRKNLAAIEEAWNAYAYDHSYHPVKDYFRSLEWNGLPQIDTLATYLQNTDNIIGVWLKRWMVGAVAKVFEQGQNKMLVLDGPQGCGKSYFVGWLASPLPDYHIEAAINPDDKDSWIRLMSNLIWEVAELGATTRKADREALKNFISTKTVTVRKSYGRYDTIKPALASLIGTINNEAGFLTDPTGNRRFLICELTKIDWNYTQLDPNQLWAEAYHLYRNGEQWELTPEETTTQRTINARYRVDSVVGDLFLKHYKIDPTVEKVTSTADIVQHLESMGLKGNQKANQMELAGFLKELGVQKVDNVRPVGYRGIAKRVI
jgi:predicted P-loop ATPase